MTESEKNANARGYIALGLIVSIFFLGIGLGVVGTSAFVYYLVTQL